MRHHLPSQFRRWRYKAALPSGGSIQPERHGLGKQRALTVPLPNIHRHLANEREGPKLLILVREKLEANKNKK